MGGSVSRKPDSLPSAFLNSQPEQIGALAAFLRYDAAAQVRGAAVPVDRGWIAQ